MIFRLLIALFSLHAQLDPWTTHHTNPKVSKGVHASRQELEIVHALFMPKLMDEQIHTGFFFAQHPSFVASTKTKKTPFDVESGENELALFDLKTRIVDKADSLPSVYTCIEDFETVAFSEIASLLRASFPSKTVPTESERMSISCDLVLEKLARNFVTNKNKDPNDKNTVSNVVTSYLLSQNAAIAMDEGTMGTEIRSASRMALFLTSGAGEGRSAVIAHLLNQLTSKYESKMLPRTPENYGDCSHRLPLLSSMAFSEGSLGKKLGVVTCLVGTVPRLSTKPQLMRRIATELKSIFKLEYQIPDRDKSLVTRFPGMLKTAGKKGEVLLIIDGVENLQEFVTDASALPEWMTSQLPHGVKLVVTMSRHHKIHDCVWNTNEGMLRVKVNFVPLHGMNLKTRKVFATQKFEEKGVMATEKIMAAFLSTNEFSNASFVELLSDLWSLPGCNPGTMHDSFYKEFTSERNYFEKHKVTRNRICRSMLKWLHKNFSFTEDVLSFLYIAREGMHEAELLELLEAKGDIFSDGTSIYSGARSSTPENGVHEGGVESESGAHVPRGADKKASPSAVGGMHQEPKTRSFGHRSAPEIAQWVRFRQRLLQLFAIELCGYISLRGHLFRRAVRDGYQIDRRYEERYLQRLVLHHRRKPLTSRKLREYPYYLKRLLKVAGGRKTALGREVTRELFQFLTGDKLAPFKILYSKAFRASCFSYLEETGRSSQDIASALMISFEDLYGIDSSKLVHKTAGEDFKVPPYNKVFIEGGVEVSTQKFLTAGVADMIMLGSFFDKLGHKFECKQILVAAVLTCYKKASIVELGMHTKQEHLSHKASAQAAHAVSTLARFLLQRAKVLSSFFKRSGVGLARTKLKNLLPSRKHGRISVMGAAGPAQFKQRHSARLLTTAEVDHRDGGSGLRLDKKKGGAFAGRSAARGRGGKGGHTASTASDQRGHGKLHGKKAAVTKGNDTKTAATNTDKDGQTCEQLLSAISILASRYVTLATVLGDDNEDLRLLMEAQQEAHEVRLHTQSVLVSVWKTKP